MIKRKLLYVVSIGVIFIASIVHAQETENFLRPIIPGPLDTFIMQGFGGQWTRPILILSNDKINAYISSDSVDMNLSTFTDFALGTSYLVDGNFTVMLVIKFKDEKARKELASDIKKKLEAGTLQSWKRPYPELLKYLSTVAFFDMQNSKAFFKQPSWIDRDGELIAFDEDATFDLKDAKHSTFFKLSNRISAFLNKAIEKLLENPKMADKLRDAQSYRKERDFPPFKNQAIEKWTTAESKKKVAAE